MKKPKEYCCPRCVADPQPPNSSPRQCLFDGIAGSFSPENWCCAAEGALFEAFEASTYARETVYGHDESIDIVPCFPPVEEGETGYDEPYGWLVFTRYKRRGRTSSAVWVGDFAPPRPITRVLIEFTIAALRRRAKPQPGTAYPHPWIN